MKLLHIDSSILDGSVSRALSRATVQRLREDMPGLDVTYRDLVATPIPHLTEAVFLAARNPEPQDQALKDDVTLGNLALEEFLAADIIVIGLGFYNLSIPSQLKAWVDRLIVAGKTFRYDENGVEGLAGGKRIILAIARGGFYGPGTSKAPHEHAETYLRSVFALAGIADIEVIAAEGVAYGPAQRAEAISAAHHAIAAISAAA